jgi:penicillin amidase
VPHIEADCDNDLFFGFGYATAQDRLFQLDYWRRQARGQLAEILGKDGLESDILYRTLGLSQIAEAEWRALPAETRDLLDAYAAGVNALVDESQGRLPIEFDLLSYRPEPWSPVDSLAIAGGFRWYLTGRFYVLVVPELVKRALGEGPLYQAFLQGEADGESILLPDSYPPTRRGLEPVGGTVSDGDEGHGSNNWVLAAGRSATGTPLFANDPHVPFGAVSIWHEVHLRGGSFHVAGVACAGMPGILIGRTERVAWGITNNICSLRDLYQEKSDPAHPGCFLYHGRWEPARERREIIHIRGAAPVVKIIRSSRNGPIVDEVLPQPARSTGPVALRWLGAEPCGWLTALLGMNRARSASEFREATRPWKVPTFNVVFADADGHIGHQCVGRIPVRRVAERGYRPGWDPQHQWDGVIPFEGMPQQADPERGFVITANNRLAADDFPYPLSGTWSSGHRARRIRERLEAQPSWSLEECRRLQYDVRSGRAAVCVPHLIELLAGDAAPRMRQALAWLQAWDCQVGTDSVPAALFNVFFAHWCRTVVSERLGSHDNQDHRPGSASSAPRQEITELVKLVAGNAGGLAADLLAQDRVGWFHRQERRLAVRAAFLAALGELTSRLGPDMNAWTWGRLHLLLQKHFLSGRGDLGLLLDRSGMPLSGDGTTICATTSDADFAAALGPSYRIVVDLADPRQGFWSAGVPGNSGHPGSPHYDDRIAPWATGTYHYLPLDESDAAAHRPTIQFEPDATATRANAMQ